MRRRRIFGIGAAASLLSVGLLGFGGVAAAGPGNLLTNGSFESTNPSVSNYLTVPDGDSTSIPGWTVVTPTVYGGTGGSVDVVAGSYWNAQDGNNSIDLAGTSASPGGIYQTVATTIGNQYTLSYWSAVNGDQSPGVAHALDVTFDGVVVGTAHEVGAGRPLQWVQHTLTVTATTTNSRIEFDDVTPGDTTQGPALDNASFTLVPTPNTPEVPTTLLLPLAAVVVGVGAWGVTRWRRRSATVR